MVNAVRRFFVPRFLLTMRRVFDGVMVGWTGLGGYGTMGWVGGYGPKVVREERPVFFR